MRRLLIRGCSAVRAMAAVAFASVGAPAAAQFNGDQGAAVSAWVTPMILNPCGGDPHCWGRPPAREDTATAKDVVPSAVMHRAVSYRIAPDIRARHVAAWAHPHLTIEMLAQFDQQLAAQNLEPGHVANVMALWLMTSWQAYHAKPLRARRETVIAVRDQIMWTWAAGGQMRALMEKTDAEKQLLGDLFVAMTIDAVVSMAQAETAGDSATIDATRRRVGEQARQFGFDLSAIAMDDQRGIMPR